MAIGVKAKVAAIWKDIVVWTKVAGTWKQATPWTNVGGTWKKLATNPLPPLEAYISYSIAGVENVSGASGTTVGHFHCSTNGGGGGGPYTFVLYWVGTHTGLAFTSSTSGESPVNYSGLVNVGDVRTGNAQAICTDTSTGNTYDTANNGSAQGMAVKRTV